MAAPPIQFGSTNASGVNVFYVQPPDQEVNTFAAFFHGYTATASPFVMQAYQAGLKALDPTARRQQLIELTTLLARMDEQREQTLRAQMESADNYGDRLTKIWQTQLTEGEETKRANQAAQAEITGKRIDQDTARMEMQQVQGKDADVLKAAKEKVLAAADAYQKTGDGGAFQSALVAAGNDAANNLTNAGNAGLITAELQQTLEQSNLIRDINGRGGEDVSVQIVEGAIGALGLGAPERQFEPPKRGVSSIAPGGNDALSEAEKVAKAAGAPEAALRDNSGMVEASSAPGSGRTDETRAQIQALIKKFETEDPLQGPLGDFLRRRRRSPGTSATSIGRRTEEEVPTSPEPPTSPEVGPLGPNPFTPEAFGARTAGRQRTTAAAAGPAEAPKQIQGTGRMTDARRIEQAQRTIDEAESIRLGGGGESMVDELLGSAPPVSSKPATRAPIEVPGLNIDELLGAQSDPLVFEELDRQERLEREEEDRKRRERALRYRPGARDSGGRRE